jgi:hypothetical protein
MPYFLLQYREAAQRPPRRSWTAVRVFIWTLLLASLVLWAWSGLAA